MRIFEITFLLFVFISCNNKGLKNQEANNETKEIEKDSVLSEEINFHNDIQNITRNREDVYNFQENLHKELLKDKIVLHLDTAPSYYHVIYIDTSRHSKYYDRLSDFKFSEYDNRNYLENYLYLNKKQPNCFRKTNNTDLCEEWLPVYMYKDNFYVYAPSGWGNARRRIINDSAFVYWYMDGPMPFPIISITKDKNLYSLEVLSIYESEPSSFILNIYRIDPKTKLSVFEYPERAEEFRYQLFIPKQSIYEYNMIVNYCEKQKQREFKFDDVDYLGLIKNVKK
jgi:hypothetical protein